MFSEVVGQQAQRCLGKETPCLFLISRYFLVAMSQLPFAPCTFILHPSWEGEQHTLHRAISGILFQVPAIVIGFAWMEVLAVGTALAIGSVAIAVAVSVPNSVVAPFICGNKLLKHVIGEIHKRFHLLVACACMFWAISPSANSISATHCSSLVSVFLTA